MRPFPSPCFRMLHAEEASGGCSHPHGSAVPVKPHSRHRSPRSIRQAPRSGYPVPPQAFHKPFRTSPETRRTRRQAPFRSAADDKSAPFPQRLPPPSPPEHISQAISQLPFLTFCDGLHPPAAFQTASPHPAKPPVPRAQFLRLLPAGSR